jgi:hypothetical protein
MKQHSSFIIVCIACIVVVILAYWLTRPEAQNQTFSRHVCNDKGAWLNSYEMQYEGYRIECERSDGSIFIIHLNRQGVEQ